MASEFGNISIDVSEVEGRQWVDWNPDNLVEVAADMTIYSSAGAANDEIADDPANIKAGRVFG
ncbi:MAG: hypothetical protein M3017_02125 [Actinomycetota bacterium]|nr:hypothetical protein [Actinomycetota bacterium]